MTETKFELKTFGFDTKLKRKKKKAKGRNRGKPILFSFMIDITLTCV